MAVATGFSNSWTSGEIFEDADDRSDIQPIAKGCKLAQNLVVQVTGPLAKRRGFWFLGGVADATKVGRLIPFRRSVADALMLELGDLTCRVWSANGSPLLNAGVQVQFASPFAASEIGKLRYKQVADVIYFMSSDGVRPQALERLTNTSWAFNALTFPNGPWQSENADDSKTITVTGASITDATTSVSPASGAILAGAGVTINASSAIFSAANVGDTMRIRAGVGTASVMGWSPGFNTPVGCFRISVGNVYESTYDAGSGSKSNATNPPVQTDGSQSDGCSTFVYLHDGAGIVTITGYVSPTQVTGTVTATLPVGSGVATSAYAFSAYGSNGWPRAWPSVVEERLALGAASGGLDFIDLTRTAGFTPLKADYHPGQGTGTVVDTDALRRRLGDDGGEILWTRQDTFLIGGTASGEYVISGGLFGEPLTPGTIIVRRFTSYGSADVYPALLEKGIAYVARGGQTVRTIRLDLQQNDSGADVSFLANHIEKRSFAQLAWIPAPDRLLWARLGDGGLAAFCIHDEQQVRGWTSQALSAPAAGALTVEDMVALPGPGGFETLWLMVSGVMGGVFQRFLMMQSQASDGLTGMDVAAIYAGAPTSAITGLDYLDGETVRILADGVAQLPQVVVAGEITVPAGTTRALVGLPWQVEFESLKLDIASLGGTLMARQRVAGCTVDLKATTCKVGYSGGLMEVSSSRQAADAVTGPVARRYVDRVTFGGDISTDPRISIVEDTPYPFSIHALRPTVVAEPVAGRGG